MKANSGRLLASIILFLTSLQVFAWTSGNIGASGAVRTLYMQVGTGVGAYPGGTGGPINTVSVSVPAVAVGNSVSQTMTATGQTNSSYDGAAMCPAGALYIAGYYRRDTVGATVDPGVAPVVVTTPANMTSSGGDTIPFSQVSWVASGGSKPGGGNFVSGSFSSTSVAMGSIPRNRWQESCLSFSYANTVLPPAGTYIGRATYTVSIP